MGRAWPWFRRLSEAETLPEGADPRKLSADDTPALGQPEFLQGDKLQPPNSLVCVSLSYTFVSALVLTYQSSYSGRQT